MTKHGHEGAVERKDDPVLDPESIAAYRLGCLARQWEALAGSSWMNNDRRIVYAGTAKELRAVLSERVAAVDEDDRGEALLVSRLTLFEVAGFLRLVTLGLDTASEAAALLEKVGAVIKATG